MRFFMFFPKNKQTKMDVLFPFLVQDASNVKRGIDHEAKQCTFSIDRIAQISSTWHFSLNTVMSTQWVISSKKCTVQEGTYLAFKRLSWKIGSILSKRKNISALRFRVYYFGEFAFHTIRE